MALADMIARLSEFNFILLGDASGSMGDVVKAGSNVTRWAAMQESMTSFARDLAQIDSDGIDIVLFGGSNITTHNNVTGDKVKDIFATRSPRGSTPLAEALTAGLKAATGDKKKFIIVFTDGVPDDKDAAAKVIVDQANSQANDDDCTFLFVQVGDDAAATKYLQQLDDDLTAAKFDIVDAKTMAEAEAFASTAELVVNAIND